MQAVNHSIAELSPSCKLMWKKPESDGGSPLVGYTVEKKSVEKSSWVPCASVSGKMAMVAKELECEVKNLIEGGVYMFRGEDERHSVICFLFAWLPCQ